jgi:hypothetical protein
MPNCDGGRGELDLMSMCALQTCHRTAGMASITGPQRALPAKVQAFADPIAPPRVCCSKHQACKDVGYDVFSR